RSRGVKRGTGTMGSVGRTCRARRAENELARHLIPPGRAGWDRLGPTGGVYLDSSRRLGARRAAGAAARLCGRQGPAGGGAGPWRAVRALESRLQPGVAQLGAVAGVGG